MFLGRREAVPIIAYLHARCGAIRAPGQVNKLTKGSESTEANVTCAAITLQVVDSILRGRAHGDRRRSLMLVQPLLEQSFWR
jgi:hypothetical protein